MQTMISAVGGVGVWLAGAGLAVMSFVSCSTASAEAKKLVVEAGDSDRAMVTMCVEAPAGITNPKMVDAGTAKPVPCQLDAGKLFWILDQLPAGKTRTYTVASDDKAKAVVEVVPDGQYKLDVKIHGKPFTTFQYDPEEIRPFCYPLFGPQQERMTRGYPMVTDIPGESHDHVHHRSFYVAYGELNDAKYNFWHEPRDKEGRPQKNEWDRQVISAPIKTESGPVFGQIDAPVDWVGKDGKKVVAEDRRTRFWAIDGTARMIDLQVTFRADYGNVHFGDTKEGGICSLRLAPEIRETGKCGGLITNSNGQKTERRTWGKRAKWVDYSRTKGEQYGVAVFDTPGNLRYPTWWHVRGYGLFTANPFGISNFDKASGQKGDYTLEKGKQLVFRYRLYLHEGTVDAASVAARYEDYVNPPKATWE